MGNIITINRQFSSGGREVGNRVAQALQCAYYDKGLMEEIAKETDFTTEYIRQYDEKATQILGVTFGHTRFYTYQQPPSHKIQLAFLKTIKEIAQKQEECGKDVVFVGRCADHILQERNPFKVFIYASDMNARIERCYEQVPADRGVKNEKQMAKEILAIDKQRASFYAYYTGQVWHDMVNYNLCIDTSKVGIDKAVELVLLALNNKSET